MSGLSDRIYMQSPIWLQQIAISLWGIRWFRKRFNRRFHRFVMEFSEREYWFREQFTFYQTSQLANVLSAARLSPHYREVFARVGVAENMNPWEALSRMPYLEKETLRTQSRELLTKSPPPKGTEVFKSSGTTGTPTEIYFSPEFHALQMAVSEARSLHVGGASYRNRRVMFGVRKVCRFDQKKPPFWRYSLYENMAYASIYHLSDGHLAHYMEFFRRYKPSVVMGYPSALHIIANYALEHHDYPPPAKMAVTTSETLTLQAREAIESVWKCKIYDRYGAVEGCVFAGQCESGRYHVSPDIAVVEIVDDEGRPCPPGKTGEVICTGLHNTLQPLIRYRIGDVARWAEDDHCPCGRSMPVIESIAGRVEDMCYTPDGRRVLRFDTVFKGIEKIKLAQVVQTAFDQYVIRVVPAPGFSDTDIKMIKRNMALHVGSVQVAVITVEDIPRSSSGKFRAVICELKMSERESSLRK